MRMKKIKEKELQLLTKICREQKLSLKMVTQLLSSAEKFSYENTTASVRTKDYIELIDYYSKDTIGER
jgi:hypothetical protein